MATKTWVGTTSSYNTAGNWSPSGVPAAGDDVVVANAATMLVDANTQLLKSWDMTSYTGILSGTFNILVAGLTASTNVVKFQNGAAATWTGTLFLSPASTTAQLNVTMGGLTTCGGITCDTNSAPIFFLDAISLGATRTLTLTFGTLHLDGLTDNAGLTHSVGVFASSNGNTRTLNFGNCTLNLSGTGTVWSCNTETGLTIIPGLSTIGVIDAGANTKTLDFGSAATPVSAQNYGSISITGSGTGAVVFNSAVTNPVIFKNFTVGRPKTVTFTAGRWVGFTGTFTAVGTASSLITLSSTTTTNATLSFGTSAVFTTDYVTSSYLTAAGTPPYVFGPNSNVGATTVGFGSIGYNTFTHALNNVYQATSGGTVFSANLVGTAAMTLFSNTAVVNDAIYFGGSVGFSDLLFNIGTAMAGTGITLAWEYYQDVVGWTLMDKLKDDTLGFTVLGVNRVRFPFHWHWHTTTVNGVASRLWVRCRITALTTITNGGANQTTAVACYNGRVEINNFSTAYPCTWLMVYNQMNTYYSYVKTAKAGSNYFDFRWFCVNVASPLLSTRETVELGVGGENAIVLCTQVFAYLQCGTKVGTSHGIDGSLIIVNGMTNSSAFSFATTTMLYDTAVVGRPTAQVGYPTIVGEFLDCNFECIPTFVTNAAIVQNTRFQSTGGVGIITQGFPANFSNNTVVISGLGLYLYQQSTTANYFNYIFTSSSGNSLFYLYRVGNNGNSFNFIDSTTTLPRMTDPNRLAFSVGPAVGVTPFANVLFYSASATTYTDYTAAANSATANDVPIWGGVGDCLYLGHATANDFLQAYFTCSNATNNYGYVMEYYHSTLGWITSTIWDRTANLTQNGYWFLQQNSDGSVGLTTINGINSAWIRLRITSVGTGSPMISMVQSAAWYGVCDYTINDLYSIVATVLNSSGAAVIGANILATDTAGVSQFTGTSSTGGVVPTGTVWNRQWYFDPVNGVIANWYIYEKNFNPYLLLVRSYGYVFQSISATIAARYTATFILQTNTNVVASSVVAGAYTGIAITGTTITVSSTMPIQQLYDYGQYWASSSGNMIYAEPFTTTTGLSFYVPSGFTLAGAENLTYGTKSIGTGTLLFSTPGFKTMSLGSTTLSFSGAGTYDFRSCTLTGTTTLVNTSGGTVTVIFSPGTSLVNTGPNINVTYSNLVYIMLTNVVVGSRYSVFTSNTSAVETDTIITAGTAASSTITIPYTYTVDTNIIVRVRKSSTAPKYQAF